MTGRTTTIDELFPHDVAPYATGDLLQWNGTTGKWEAGLHAPTLFPDGIEGSPSIAFASEPSTGFWKRLNAEVNLSLAGVERYRFNANVLTMRDIAGNDDGLQGYSIGGTHIWSLMRQEGHTVGDTILSSFAGIGFAPGATTGPETVANSVAYLNSTGLRIEPTGVTSNATSPLDVRGGYAQFLNAGAGIQTAVNLRNWNAATSGLGVQIRWLGEGDRQMATISSTWLAASWNETRLDFSVRSGGVPLLSMRLDGSGARITNKLAVGTTTAPAQTFEVEGNALIRPDATWSAGDTAYLYMGDTSHSIAVNFSTRSVLTSYYGWEFANTTKTVVTIDSAHLVTFSDLIQVGSYAVGSLPAGAAAQVAYASDGRKAGEGAGSGTGVLVFHDGSNWIACDTGATVAA